MTYAELNREELIALLQERERPGSISDERDRLIHELEVHQAELESQNAQLRETQVLLEESRALYADLYDFAPIGYCTVSAAGNLLRINLAGAALLGRERGRLVGTSLASFVDAGQRRALRNHLSEVLEKGDRGAQQVDVQIGERTVRIISTSDRDAGSGQMRCRTVLCDFTEQKRAEEAIRLSLRMREDFLAIVSHDLRNPLNAIVMGTEVLMQETPVDERRKAGRRQLESIRRSSDRMNRLLADLLDLSSMDAGHLSMQPAEHDPGAILAVVQDLMVPVAAAKKIRLRSESQTNGVPAYCDRERIVQVLLNLVGNALKFTAEGGEVTIRVEAEGDGLAWSVRDDGIGMSERQQAQIFLPYWKVDRVSKKGTGLGLAIARGIVEAAGGTIRVKSGVGHGSTFTFTWPGKAARERKAAALGAAPMSPTRAASRVQSLLIVDDEVDARDTLADLLRDEGYTVITAADGQEALEVLRRPGSQISLVLLDLVMPRMDGWTFLGERARDPRLVQIPVVLISGQCDAPATARAFDVAGVVEKPIRLPMLRSAVARIITPGVSASQG